MNELRHSFWQIGEHSVSGMVLGAGEDLAICFPGFSLSGEWMAKHYPSLWTNKTCYFLNWPGLVDVEAMDIPFDIEIIREWISQILSEKKWSKIYLIGHSFGARVGLKLLFERPFADELILIAPVVKIKFWEYLIQAIPNATYIKLINHIFSLNSIQFLSKAAGKLGFLNIQERMFLESHFNSEKNLKFLKHYAISLKKLKMNKTELEFVLKTLKKCQIYLFKNDRFCQNTFWINLARDKYNCELILLNGGHFGRLK